jgi:DNA ligase (NAD+)
VGEVIAQSVKQYFAEPKNRNFIERLRAAGLKMSVETSGESEGTALSGMAIVISGVFSRHSREEYKKIIEQQGGRNVTSISAKTSFVLAGENMGPTKLEKASKLGVRIVAEEEFLEMLEGGNE